MSTNAARNKLFSENPWKTLLPVTVEQLHRHLGLEEFQRCIQKYVKERENPRYFS